MKVKSQKINTIEIFWFQVRLQRKILFLITNEQYDFVMARI